MSRRFVQTARHARRSEASGIEPIAPASVMPLRITDLVHYPVLGGRTKTVKFDNSGSAPAQLLNVARGVSGVVRSIWFVHPFGATGTDWQALAAWKLRCYVDQNATPVDIPLAELLACNYRSAPSTQHDLPFCEAAYDSVVSQEWVCLNWSLPIPFADGIRIELRNGSGAIVPSWFWVSYEEGALPDQLAGWRLNCSRFSDTILNSASGVFLDRPRGCKGMLLGLFMGFQGDGVEFMENNIELYDPEIPTSPVWQSSSIEDLIGCNPHYITAGGRRTAECGVDYFASDTVVQLEAHRVFLRDPIVWNDGVVGKLPCTDEAYFGDLAAHITTLFYEKRG